MVLHAKYIQIKWNSIPVYNNFCVRDRQMTWLASPCCMVRCGALVRSYEFFLFTSFFYDFPVGFGFFTHLCVFAYYVFLCVSNLVYGQYIRPWIRVYEKQQSSGRVWCKWARVSHLLAHSFAYEPASIPTNHLTWTQQNLLSRFGWRINRG